MRLEDARLWALEGQGYEAWVCGLADALLAHARSPTLRMLQRPGRKKAALAELLLPHAAADLASHDADTTLVALLSEQARPFLLFSAQLCGAVIYACMQERPHREAQPHDSA